MATKKAWEFLLSPIPVVRLSHCPHARISNAVSQRQVILYMQQTAIHYNIYSNCRDIIHPRRRFVALPLCMVSNLRDLTTQNSNVRKRLSETSLTNGFAVSHPSMSRPTSPCGTNWVICKDMEIILNLQMKWNKKSCKHVVYVNNTDLHGAGT